MVAEYNRKRKYVLNELRKMSLCPTLDRKGAFYVFPNFSKFNACMYGANQKVSGTQSID